MASKALGELIRDEPLGVRVREALKYLHPIVDNPADFEHRRVIVEEIEKSERRKRDGACEAGG